LLRRNMGRGDANEPRVPVVQREPGGRRVVRLNLSIGNAGDVRDADALQEDRHPVLGNGLLKAQAPGKGAVMTGSDVLHHAALEVEDRRLQVRLMEGAEPDRTALVAGAFDLELAPGVIRMSDPDRALAVELA